MGDCAAGCMRTSEDLWLLLFEADDLILRSSFIQCPKNLPRAIPDNNRWINDSLRRSEYVDSLRAHQRVWQRCQASCLLRHVLDALRKRRPIPIELR